MSAAGIQRALIEVEDSVLIVIDIQDHFLRKYDRAKGESLVAKVAWLIRVARRLDVPVIAMAEDIGSTGGLNETVRAALPDAAHVHDKDLFNAADNPDILADLASTGRRTAVCVGMETDVCVAQTALGLIGQGYAVAALRDAVASMAADEEVGLARMRDAGVAISSVKALYYEWLRGVSRTRALKAMAPELEATRPATLIL